MQHRKLLVLVSLLAIAPVQAPMARIYKWVDANGDVHYSEQAPPESKARELKVQSRPADTAELDRLKEKAGLTPPKEGAKTPEEALAPTAADKAADAKQRQKNCQIARKNLEVLGTSRRVATKDEKGNYVRLDDNQRQAQMEQARKQIEENCK